MIKNNKGVTFMQVVGTVIFLTIIVTTAMSFAMSNGLIVTNYSAKKQSYNLAYDKLNNAAVYVKENIGNSSTKAAIETKLSAMNLSTDFGIEDYTIADGGSNQYTVRIKADGYYIDVFLSGTGGDTVSAQLFQQEDTKLPDLFKVNVLGSSYLYENRALFDTNEDDTNEIIRNPLGKKSVFGSEDNNRFEDLTDDNDAYVLSKFDSYYDSTNRRTGSLIDQTIYQIYYNNIVKPNLADSGNITSLETTRNGVDTYTVGATNSVRTNVYYEGDISLSQGLYIGKNTNVYIDGDLTIDLPNYIENSDTVTETGLGLFTKPIFQLLYSSMGYSVSCSGSTCTATKAGSYIYQHTLEIENGSNLIVMGDLNITSGVLCDIKCDGANVITSGNFKYEVGNPYINMSKADPLFIGNFIVGGSFASFSLQNKGDETLIGTLFNSAGDLNNSIRMAATFYVDGALQFANPTGISAENNNTKPTGWYEDDFSVKYKARPSFLFAKVIYLNQNGLDDDDKAGYNNSIADKAKRYSIIIADIGVYQKDSSYIGFSFLNISSGATGQINMFSSTDAGCEAIETAGDDSQLSLGLFGMEIPFEGTGIQEVQASEADKAIDWALPDVLKEGTLNETYISSVK